MIAKTKAPVLTRSESRQQKTTTTPSARNRAPSLAHFNDHELRALGMVRARDGYLLNNADEFYDHHLDELATYDTRTRATHDPRTHVVVSHGLLDRLLLALMYEAEHRAYREAA